MALTVTQLVTAAGSKSSAVTSQVTATLSAAAAIGDTVLAVIGADNAGASGVSSLTTVIDSKGNTYTKTTEKNQTPGAAAADGCTVAIFESVLTVALTTSDTITFNFSPATTARCWAAIKINGTPGSAYSTDVGAGAGTTYTGAASASMANGDLIVAVCVNESNTEPVDDSDTTNGSWVSFAFIHSAGTGGDATKLAINGMYKIVTGAGTQTFNGSTGANTDWAVVHALYTTPAIFFSHAIIV